MQPSRVPFVAVAIATVLATLACHRAVQVGSPSSATPAGSVRQITPTGDFRGELGVQLWSFRDQVKNDAPAMLRMTRAMGLTHVETAGMYGMTAPQFAEALRAAGLRATSMHVGYDEFKNNPDKVIADAKALGVKYVGTAWYPHEGAFTEADARKAIADFNAFGRRMKEAGLTFFYHDHGYEAVPYRGNETLLDLIIQETNPDLVKFEMDVLWTWLPGVDPVALIRKYPGRFRLMHIKDMKPGIARGSLSGGLPAEQQAAIGEGQIPWGALMAAAARDGLEHYYIEDETPDPVNNVPKSISYLERLRFN